MDLGPHHVLLHRHPHDIASETAENLRNRPQRGLGDAGVLHVPQAVVGDQHGVEVDVEATLGAEQVHGRRPGVPGVRQRDGAQAVGALHLDAELIVGCPRLVREVLSHDIDVGCRG